MKKKSSGFRVRSPLQDNILSLSAILSLIALTLAAVAGVFWLLARAGVISPDWMMFDPQTEQTETAVVDGGLFDVLRPTEDEAPPPAQEIVRFSGSFSTLRALLSDLDTPDQYNTLFRTTLYSGHTPASSTIRVYRARDAFRINRHPPGTTTAGTPQETYICDGTAVMYQNLRTAETAIFPISPSFSVEALAGIPSIASFNAIPEEQILHASYTEQDGEIVYYVLYTTPTAADASIVHEVLISAISELVLQCRTYMCAPNDDPMTVIHNEDALLYASELISFARLSDREQQVLFTLPDQP